MLKVSNFTLEIVDKVLFGGEQICIDEKVLKGVENCHEFLKGFAKEKVIYGINTGFGPMAQWRVEDERLKELQYNIIRSHSTGAGEPLEDVCVRAAMMARLGSILQCRSGVHREVAELLVEFINRGICPFIPRHGSVGASGDLVQLAHIALTLIGEGKVHYKGEWRETKEVMKETGLKPIGIHVREGLSITNGTSVMTGIACVNQHYAEKLLEWSVLASVWMNEIASSYNDLMAAPLNECRRHEGQIEIARKMRELSADSKCLLNREHELYNDGHTGDVTFGHKVQPYYSLRCTPQIMGPIWETLKTTGKILEEELQSASDNPIVDPETKNVYHGGNFHGDYISLEEDKVKIAVVRMAMTAERQLNYLFHDRINGILPPFLNMGVLGLNYGMQACQFTATSTTAECQTLAMPNYVHSIPNNNDNQDIVSMGTNTALLCRQVIDNCFQVMAIHFIALAQATDCLKKADKLCSATKKQYDEIRKIIPAFVEDTPFYDEIAEVEKYLRIS
ncbi:MAG: aromatic amino acid lyase [Bacteroidales bacterium]|nr:aromatic amino acid lyase [Bacteroidales bacterium]MBQ6741817.1 aromatic amino acid lyase [Bacteroidales bacterium]